MSSLLSLPRSLVARVADFNIGKPYPVVIPRPDGPSKRWGQSSTALAQRPVRVVNIVRETGDAVTLELEVTDGRPVEFRSGQYLTHCFEVGDSTLKRAYSISAAEGERLACTIKAIDGGRVSSFVHRRVSVGYQYTVLGPSGDFVLGEDPSVPLAFLAAGSGITPVISMIETALRCSPERLISLVYASRREGDIIFAARLAALAKAHPQLQVVHVLSQPEPGWTGEVGRLTGERAARLMSPDAAAQVFLCGPGELMDATSTALTIEGVDPERVHCERFYAAPSHTRVPPTAPQQLEFRASGRKVTQRPGETILDAGLRSGVKLDFSCTVGGCAACKIKVVSGDVTIDEPNCLSAQERAQGYVLGCSAYANEGVVLDA